MARTASERQQNACQRERGCLSIGALLHPPSAALLVVMWAHGYVAPQEELAIPDDMIGDRSIAEIVTSLRFAYATTSYRPQRARRDRRRR